MVLYRRDEAAGKEALPSGAYGLQARREAPYFWRGRWEHLCRNGAKSIFGLPSLAAQLRTCVYPFTLHPQVAAKKKCTSGSVLASPVGLLGAFPRFVRSAAASLTNRRPKSGEIVPFGHKLPWLPRPCGACLLDIYADADTATRSRPPQPNIQAYGGIPASSAVGSGTSCHAPDTVPIRILQTGAAGGYRRPLHILLLFR